MMTMMMFRGVLERSRWSLHEKTKASRLAKPIVNFSGVIRIRVGYVHRLSKKCAYLPIMIAIQAGSQNTTRIMRRPRNTLSGRVRKTKSEKNLDRSILLPKRNSIEAQATRPCRDQELPIVSRSIGFGEDGIANYLCASISRRRLNLKPERNNG